ncbi:MAG: hypothetical protein UZ17_ACD001001589 [Acidobacteria bacterium OLB17]|nr:MAG: hypothetical protein UZ17_ACD001001589 [Acidobacteria bacterium OLB17]MCZ2391391.1 hypothetical protein [Acidobacteriota bacterium]
MKHSLIEAAYYTFILQLYLFAIPAAASICYLLREVFANKETPAENYEKPSRELTPDIPALQPLNCPACGAGVPLDESKMTCVHCRAEFPVPPEYEEVRTARAEAAKNLHLAERYWRIASVLASNLTVGAVLFVSAWLIACLAVVFWIYNTDEMIRFRNVLHPFAIPVATEAIWIAMLLFIGISISLKVRAALPEIKETKAAAKDEISNCKNCGGAIHFRAGDLAALCGYCGVSTYRVAVAVKVAADAGRTARESSAILVVQMRALKDSVEEYLSVPILVIAVPIVLVAVAWFLFAALGAIFGAFIWGLAYLIVGLRLYPIPTASAIVIFGLLFYFRKAILRRLRSDQTRR